jgi:hypothetical protein
MFKVRVGQWPRIGPAAYTGPSRLKRSGRLPENQLIRVYALRPGIAR